MNLSDDEAAFFLKEFRSARYSALEDAENFREICFVLEEFGCRLAESNLRSLRKYKPHLYSVVHSKRRSEFSALFDMVNGARNDSAHTGVFARNAASRAVRLAIFLEEELVKVTTKAKHLMSEGVVFAEEFHSLSKVREIMLEHSFSYLPIYLNGKYYFISDYLVGKKWNDPSANDFLKYNTRIVKILQTAELSLAKEILSNTVKKDIYSHIIESNLPLLVVDGNHERRKVVGIITPFDLL